jgi:hypothetical protein
MIRIFFGRNEVLRNWSLVWVSLAAADFRFRNSGVGFAARPGHVAVGICDRDFFKLTFWQFPPKWIKKMFFVVRQNFGRMTQNSVGRHKLCAKFVLRVNSPPYPETFRRTRSSSRCSCPRRSSRTKSWSSWEIRGYKCTYHFVGYALFQVKKSTIWKIFFLSISCPSFLPVALPF